MAGIEFCFSTPPLAKEDFTKKSSFVQWSKFVDETTSKTIAVEEETVGVGKCQYYNPKYTPPAKDKKEAKVTWNGFPRRLTKDYPDCYLEVADRTDGWPRDGPEYEIARNQDEYLEWYVYKNDAGKISRIDFTCESPEYWDKLWEWEPDVCLELYRTHISPDVKMADLSKEENGKQVYNMYNKWNTTDGCMHLQCPPNSLSAEIQLGGDATIIRKTSDGTIITGAQDLIECSKYGLSTRNSDPHIGSACNELCRDGKRITLADPVCLFIAAVRLNGWTTPDGKDARQYMELVRGIKDKGLRYKLQVPESENFVVGDIMIAGEPITYGGQVTQLMDVGLVAEHCKNTDGAQAAHDCVPSALKNEKKQSFLQRF